MAPFAPTPPRRPVIKKPKLRQLTTPSAYALLGVLFKGASVAASPNTQATSCGIRALSRGVAILIGAQFVKRDGSGSGRALDFPRLTF